METTQLAIIGGGFSGVAAALHFLRFHGHNQKVILFESQAQLGEGVAYQTKSDAHLLNVTADKMGIFYDDPRGFYFWLQARGYDQILPSDFVPRKLYGDYLKDYLQYFKSRYSNFSMVHDEVVSVQRERSGYILETVSGSKIFAEMVVGALGVAPKKVELVRPVSQIENIWSERESKKFPPGTQFAIVGSGLSMIDFVMGIQAENPTALFWSLSRHGRLPLAHRPVDEVADLASVQIGTLDLKGSPRQILRILKNCAKSQPSSSWVTVAEELRKQAPAIWKTWSLKQRSQFLRHLKSAWESIRHRAPPSADRTLQKMKESGQLEIQAGRLESIDQNHILWRPRGEDRLCAKKFDFLVPLMGTETDITKSESRLQKQMYRDGLILPDALRLGIQTDMQGRPIDSTGDVLKNFYLIGPHLRPLFWESTAVPEIRQQIAKWIENLADKSSIRNLELRDLF